MQFFLAGTLVSIVLSGPFIYLATRFYYRARKRISWAAFFGKLASANARAKILVNGRKPDIIIGVNSGIVPAAILAFNYQIAALRYLLCMPNYSPEGDRLKSLIDLGDLKIAGKYVLIVDDQYYSGDTLREIREAVAQLPDAATATIRTFAVYAYETDAKPVRLDIPNLGWVSGVLAKAPWAFSDEVARHYLERRTRRRRLIA
jgi:hypoxanthine phosphoribosyltransferase